MGESAQRKQDLTGGRHRSERLPLGRLLLCSVSAYVLGSLIPVGSTFADGIQTDGRTATSVEVIGSQTDIRTQTIVGDQGVNTFAQFGVGVSQSVNIHVPTGASGTVNIVNGPRSVINGAVRSVKGGNVGGSMVFANPNGVVVGQGGSFKAGTVNIANPSQSFVDGFIGADGKPSASHVDQLINGTAPTSDADIEVHGDVSGSQSVVMRTGGKVVISGNVTAGERSGMIAGAVNTGRVDIKAAKGVTVRGTGRISGVSGDAGGDVEVRSSGAIRVESGARIEAEGVNSGNGGSAIVFGGDLAVLEKGAVISSSALGNGDGGFVELSADDTVELAGKLSAASAFGDAGSILIDPLNYTQSNDLISNTGEDITIQANLKVTIAPNVTISTRKVNDGGDGVVSAAETLNNTSEGKSGSLTIEARQIEIGAGVNLVSFATGGFAGGDINILAHHDDLLPADALLGLGPEATVSVDIDSAFLRGRDINIDLDVSKSNLITSMTAVSDYAAAITDGTALAPVDDLFSGRLSNLDAQVSAITNRQQVAALPVYSGALAHVSIRNSTLVAGRDVSITADASNQVLIAPVVNSISAAIAGTATEAIIVVDGSPITADNAVTIAANTTETVDLNAFSGNTATGTGDGSNAAAAMSFRWNETAVIVNANETGGSPGLAISAGEPVSMTANSTKDISVEAIVAADSQGRGEAITASYESSDVRVALGGLVTTTGDKLDLVAATEYAQANNRAIVATMTNPSQPAAIGNSVNDTLAGWISQANSALSDVAGIVNSTLASTTTGAFTVVDHSVTTRADFGGVALLEDPITGDAGFLNAAGFDPDISGGGTARLNVKARNHVDQLSGASVVLLGSAANAGSAFITALGSDVWRLKTAAEIGSNAVVADGTRALVQARSDLPTIDDSGVRDLQRDVQDAFASSTDFELVPVAYQLVPVADLFDEANYITDVQVATSGGASVALNGGRRRYDIDTTAAVRENADFLGSTNGELSVDASTSGGIAVRRIELSDWQDTAATTRGAGGSLQIIDVNVETTAIVEEFNSSIDIDPTEFAEISVTATNYLGVVGETTSYGEAGVFSLNGGAVHAMYDGSATALFDSRNFISAGVLLVDAQENAIVAAEAGAGQISGKSGVGLAYAVVDANRSAIAEYRPASHVSPGIDDTLDPNLISAFAVTSSVDGISMASAAAGAKTAEEEGTSSSGGLPDFASWSGSDAIDLGGDGVAGGNVSVQAAADFAYVNDDTTVSSRTDSVRRAQADIVGVSATDTSMALAGAGAATSGAGTVGLGGAIARLDSHRLIEAVVDHGAWRVVGSPGPFAGITIAASDQSVARVLAVGRGGDAPAALGQYYGSLAWLNTETDVDAILDYETGTMPYVSVSAERLGGSIVSGGALDRENDATTDPDEASRNGVGVGITVAFSTIDEDVRAELIAPPKLVTDRVTVTATNDSRNWTLARSQGANTNWTVAGAGILANSTQTTSALVSGRVFEPTSTTDFYDRSRILLGDFLLEPEFDVGAINTSVNKLWIGTDAGSEKVSAGGSVISVNDTRTTETEISTVWVETFSDTNDFDNPVYPWEDETPPEYAILSRLAGTLNSGQRSGAGGDGGLAGDVTVTTVLTDWDTKVTLDDAGLSYAKEISVAAVDEASLWNVQRGMSEADKGAGTIGVAVTGYDSVVNVSLVGSSLSTMDPDITDNVSELGDITVSSLSDATIRTKAVRSGDGKASGGVTFNEMRSTGETSVLFERGIYQGFDFSFDTASSVYGGDIAVTATDQTWREVVASASATADAVGIAGALVHDVYQRDTLVVFDGGSVGTEFGEESLIGSYSDIRATDIAIGRANGGATFGTALVGVLVKDDRDVVAEALTGIPIGGEITGSGLITAQRSDINLLMQVTELVAGSGGGAGMGVMLTGGRTFAGATVSDFGSVYGDITFLAKDSSKHFNLGLGAGQTDRFGGTGSLSYMQIGRPSAVAALLEEGDRGTAERDNAEDVKVAIGDAIEGERGANTGLFDVSDVDIRASLTIAAEAGFNMDGNLTLQALDERRAYAVAGQLQAGIVGAAGQFIDKHFEIDTVNASGFELTIMPFGNGEADDSETEEDIGVATDDPEETSAELEDAKDIADGSAPSVGGGTSLGVAVSYLRLGGTVEALLDVAPVSDDPGVFAYQSYEGTINISAISNAQTAALAAGATIGTGNAIAGTAALARQYQYVRAAVTGGGVIGADRFSNDPLNVNVGAATVGKSWSVASQATVGLNGNVGGATVAVNDFDAVTVAEIVETDIDQSDYEGGYVTVTATNSADVLAAALSGGGSSSNAFGLSVGYAGNRGITAARISGADISRNTNSASVTVSSTNSMTLTSLLAQANIGLSNGAGASLAIAKMNGETTAEIIDSNIGPGALQALLDNGDLVWVRAISDGKLNAASVGIAGGNTIGGSGSVAITDKQDRVRAEIADSNVSVLGDVKVEANSTSAFGSVGGGDNGILSQILAGNINITGGGTGAIGITVAIAKASSEVDALISGDSDIETGGDVEVVASSVTDLKGMTVTMGGGGSFAGAVQLPLFFAEDAVTAAIDASGTGSATAVAGGDVIVDADSETSVKSFVLTVAGGGAVGAGIDVEYLRLGTQTVARIDNAEVEAGGSVRITADTDATLATNSYAGGASGTVGLAGIVQVALSETETLATINATDITAGEDIELAADAETDIDQTSGQLSFGATVGLGGNVMVLNGRDKVRAEVLDAASPVSVARSVLNADGTVRIAADIDTTLNSSIYGLAGGTVGITATVFVSRFEQDVAARLGDYAEVAGGANSLTVDAEQSFTQISNIGAISGGFVGIGASIGANSMANSVLAEIGDGAMVDVSGDVTVEAEGIRNFTGTSVGVSGGAFAFSGSILSVTYGKPMEAEETGDHMARVNAALENDDPYGDNGDASNEDDDVASYMADAKSGRQNFDLLRLSDPDAAGKDEIKARVGSDAILTAGDDITVKSVEGGEVSIVAGSGAGGIVGATAGIISMRRGSTLTTEIGSQAVLTAGDDVLIEAFAEVDNDSSKDAPMAFTGAGGLVAVAGAVSRVVADRNIDVSVGEAAAIDAGGKATVRAEEATKTRANAVGGAAGAIAVGGTVAFASHESTIDVAFATGTVRPEIDASEVEIEIRRNGDVKATATAAQAAAISVNGVDTTAKDSTVATIDLGRLDIDATGGLVDIHVNNEADVESTATGVSVSGIAAQGAFASANRTAQSIITSSSSTRIDAGTLNIVAVDALSETGRSTVLAKTTSIAGGIAGSVGGALSDTRNDSRVEIDLRLREFDVSGDARIAALGRTELIGKSIGVTTGTAAFGANRTKIVDTSDTLVTLTLDENNDGALDVDGALTIEALSDQDVDNDVTSGQGGVLGIAAAWVTTELDSNTEVTLDSAIDSTLYAGSFVARASHTLNIEATGDSYEARVVGAGATTIDTTADANVDVEFDAISVEAAEILVEALADMDKNSDRFDGRIGELGFVSGTSLAATTQLDTDLDIIIRDTNLTQTVPGTEDTRGIDLAIRSNTEGTDALKIDTGGAIKAARADSTMLGDVTGTILIDNSDITSDGQLNATVVADADLFTEVYVNVYGLAGVPTGDSIADFDATQKISVINGSRLESAESNTNLEVTGGVVDVDSTIRIFNGTAIPITRQPDAQSRLTMVNTIDIEDGADVLAAQDVSLRATAGDVDLYSYGTSSDYYRETAEAVINAFGDLVGADDVSLQAEVGDVVNSSRFVVTNEGHVEAGSRHIQRLVVNADGSIRTADDGVIFEVVPDFDPSENLRTYIEKLEAEIEEFAGDEAFVAQRQAAIDRLEQLIDDLNGETIDIVRVNDVFASGGNVIADTDVLAGSGSITANGDALIEIINESRAHLEVGDLVIPFRNGGDLYLNGAIIDTNNDITKQNNANISGDLNYALNPPGSASFSLSLDGPAGADPVINIENRYIGTGPGLTGDMIVTGTVENLTGSASLLTADGNIYVFGEVNARTVDIRSGGDFFLVAAIDDYLTNVDDPLGVYAAYFEEVEDNNLLASCGWSGHANCSPEYETLSGGGKILGVGSVYIYANTLNVNGTIQSGITDWNLDISAEFDDLFDLFSPVDEITTVYAPAGVDGYGSSYGNWINSATGQPYVSGNAFLRYDRANDIFIVDPMVTKGGTVELVGNIISTGSGSILAADGYGRVDVTSEADIPVHFSTISTGYGDGVEGLIRIVDTARPGFTPGTFVTTEYRQLDDGAIERKIINESLNSTLMRGLTNVQYDIEGDWAVENRIGQKRVETVVRTEQRSTIVNVGTFESVIDSETTNETTEVTGSTPIIWDERTLQQAFDDPLIGGGQAGNSTLQYEFVRETDMGLLGAVLDGYLLQSDATDWEVVSNVGGTTIERRTVTEVRLYNEYSLHTIPANEPIDIGFHGYNVSEVNITTRGDAVFTGGLYNRAGLTEIVSTDGSILSDGPSVIFDTNRLILNAAGDIGERGKSSSVNAAPLFGGGAGVGFSGSGFGVLQTQSLGALKVDVVDGFGFTALAGDRIRVEELSGDMNIIAVDSSNRDDIRLTADGSILKHSGALPGSFVNGGAITLTARGGSIGDLSSLAPIWLDSDRITATAAGDISLYQAGSDLNLNTLNSAGGNVTVVVSGGSIRDDNAFSRVDKLAEAGLLEALWDELGLRGNDYADGSANTRDVDALAAFEETQTAAYFNYWKYRLYETGFTGPLGNAIQGVSAYDPNLVVTFGDDQRQQLTANGLSDADIAATEAAETIAFHEAHAIWGQEGYNPNFSYVATSEERDPILGGAFVSTGKLELGLRRSLVLPVTDTVTEIETANITGVDINLMADADVGESEDAITFLNSQGLTQEARLALWTAERADISINKGNSFTVAQNEDIDVEAAGTLQAIAGNDVFVGSESHVALQTLFAGDDARLKTADGISGVLRGGMLVNVTGKNIVLEGGDGAIGEAFAPVLVAQEAGGVLAARATGSVRIASVQDSFAPLEVFEAQTALVSVLAPGVVAVFDHGGKITGRGSIGVSEIFSEDDVVLTALSGDVTDANANDEADILADNITLTAGGQIGFAANPLEVATQATQASINAISNDGDLNLVVTQGDVVATAIGSVNGSTRLTVDGGSLRLDGAGGVPAIYADQDLVLRVAGGVAGKDGLALDMAAKGSTIIFAEGDMGSALAPLVTAFDSGSLLTTASLTVVDANDDDDIPVSAWFVNAGDVAIEEIDLDTQQSVFGLINNGEVLFENPLSGLFPGGVIPFSADRINIAAFGQSATGSDAEVRINESILFAGSALNLTASGRVWVDDGETLELSGDVTINALGLRMDDAGPLTLNGSGSLEITTSREIRTGDITAEDTRIILAATDALPQDENDIFELGFIEVGNVTAASLQTSGLSFGGGRIEADTININATISVLADVLAPNTSLEIDTFSLGDIDAPVTIEADADLETVRIDAGFLGNLAISGFPGIGFDLLRSGYDEDGVYEALIADNEEFAALGIGREGFGIMVETDGAVLIETDGVDTNGSDVSIIASQIGQSAPIATRGGDVSLVSTAGNIRQLAGSAIDSGNGSVLLDSAGDLGPARCAQCSLRRRDRTARRRRSDGSWQRSFHAGYSFGWPPDYQRWFTWQCRAKRFPDRGRTH
jgi:hypothetical protein